MTTPLERTCGTCTQCCTVMTIADDPLSPDFSKPAGTTCEHCTQAGCAIYETRYPVCRSFTCGWLVSPSLPDRFRPDVTGIIISGPGEFCPEVMFGYKVFAAHECWPDAATTTGEQLLYALATLHIIIVVGDPGSLPSPARIYAPTQVAADSMAAYVEQACNDFDLKQKLEVN